MRYLMAALLALMLGLMLPVPAYSAGAAASSAQPGTSVEMPFLIAPISIEDRLEGYAYISSKVVAATPSAAIEVRDKLAFIQDAYVRDVNGAPVTKSGDPKTVDVALLVSRLLADAKRVVGAEKVVGITITQVQVAPLRSNGETEAGGPPS